MFELQYGSVRESRTIPIIHEIGISQDIPQRTETVVFVNMAVYCSGLQMAIKRSRAITIRMKE